MPGVFYTNIAKYAFSRPKSPKLWVSQQESPKCDKKDALAGGTSLGTFTTEGPSCGFYNTLPINGRDLNFQPTEGVATKTFQAPVRFYPGSAPAKSNIPYCRRMISQRKMAIFSAGFVKCFKCICTCLRVCWSAVIFNAVKTGSICIFLHSFITHLPELVSSVARKAFLKPPSAKEAFSLRSSIFPFSFLQQCTFQALI